MKFKRLLHSFPIFLGLLVAPFIANGADLNEILKKGEVVIAVPEAFPPFGSVGKTGKHEGYDVDVAKLIAKDLGVKLKLGVAICFLIVELRFIFFIIIYNYIIFYYINLL